LACLIGFILTTERSKDHRAVGWGLIGGSLALIPLFTWFQIRRARRRDLQPDIMGLLFDTRQQVQIGDVQLWPEAKQLGPILRVRLVLQNITDGARAFDLDLPVRAGAEALADPAIPTHVEIGPAGVSVVRIDIPLQSDGKSRTVRLGFLAKVSGRGGKQVRFCDRPLMLQKPSLLALAGGGLGGGFIGGFLAPHAGEAFLEIRTNGLETRQSSLTRSEVEVTSIWIAGDPVDEAKLGEAARTVLERSPSA